MTTTDQRSGQGKTGTQASAAAALTDNRPDQYAADTHDTSVGPVQTSPQANEVALPKSWSPAGIKPASSQSSFDTQIPFAAGSKPTDNQLSCDAQSSAVVGPDFPADHGRRDDQARYVGGEQTEEGIAATILRSSPIHLMSLADPFLALAADVLDDTEHTKNANQNRLRQLTRNVADSDGELRGFGLDESHPDVARLAALVDLLGKVEHQATLNLQRLMRQHPLGAWGKAQKGVGEKQFARLLAVIGDPYWNTLHDRPRTVSELWAYCGLHTLPTGQNRDGTQPAVAGGGSSPAGSDQQPTDAPFPSVAARRAKGQRANWSTLAKTRSYLIAESMLKAGNREAYDTRKARTEGRVHVIPCAPCGPKGKPAEVGSPWSAKHRHQDALRIASKTFLRDLWREAKRLHAED